MTLLTTKKNIKIGWRMLKI